MTVFPFVFIETPRLLLRELTPEVYQFVFNSYSENELMDFFGLPDKNELAAERERFEKGYTTFNKTMLMFHLIDKKTNATIGWCGFHTWYVPHARAEIGYSINHESSKAKGFMKEALPYVIDHGFRKMNLHRIEALVGPENTASLLLINGLGFTKEGLLREHYFKNGRYEDSIFFSLLRKEYAEFIA